MAMTTIKTRNVTAARRRGGAARASAGFWVRLGILVQVMALLGGIFVLFSYRVSLGEKLTATARETAKVKREIHELDREIEALRIKKEDYSRWSYIKGQIDRYQLGLRVADPVQRRQLAVSYSRSRGVSRAAATAQR